MHNLFHRTALAVGIGLAVLPGAAQEYFQQRVDHTIRVTLDDEAHLLRGTASFTYHNNSPHALDTIWLHLWPNAYSGRHTALNRQMVRNGDLSLHFASEEERGHIDSLDLRVVDMPPPIARDRPAPLHAPHQLAEKPASWGPHPQHADIAWLKLPLPLQPGGTVTISTPFRVKIPDGRFSRLGHTGQAYYITQWYPKPAVFDRDGWHAMPYLTQGEFYGEFGRFDVTITLPANYVVGATGVLQDETERAWLDSLAATPFTGARTPGTASPGEQPNAFPPSSARTKTIRFVQDRVHDFAWFADKRFIVRKGRIALPESGREVTTWVMFTPKNAALWADALTYVNESVRFYSEHVGEYPYDACTAVDGTISAGGGMEYPMITIIGQAGSPAALDEVIAHEVGHNWFYGILGSNERHHAWMDEGMNSFLELRYMRARYPGRPSSFAGNLPRLLTGSRTIGHREAMELGYRLNARRNLDQPPSLTSEAFTSTNYGTCVYMKSALIMDHLMAWLGEETMDKCLHAYFEEWKFRHPRPEDLRMVFERESGKDLGWVFDGSIGSDLKFDARARRMLRSGPGRPARVRIVGEGIGQVPVPIAAYAGNDSLGTIWSEAEPRSKNETVEIPWSNADRIRIDAGNRTLDIDRRNNEVRDHGLFRRSAPLRIKPLMSVEDDRARTLHYLPIPAWNQHDGWQLGLVLHNMSFPSRRTEWVAVPLYSFTNARIGGAGRIEHHFDRLRSRVFQNIALGMSARSQGIYADPGQGWVYEKVSPYARFDLKRDPLARPWKHSLLVRGVYLNTGLNWVADVYDFPPEPQHLLEQGRFLAELRYTAADGRKLGPTRVEASLQAQMEDDDPEWAGRFVRASLEVQRGFTYNERGKQLRLRAFGGAFLHKYLSPWTSLEAWSLSWGPEDLFFDNAYFDRGRYHDGLFGRQFSEQQGAFKTPFRGSGSDTWIAAMNAELDLPFKLPLALFASAGWAPITTVTTEGITKGPAGYLEGGFGVPLVRDVLEVWFPVFVSDRIRTEEDFAGRGFGDRIRFVLALERLDPTRIVRSIKP